MIILFWRFWGYWELTPRAPSRTLNAPPTSFGGDFGFSSAHEFPALEIPHGQYNLFKLDISFLCVAEFFLLVAELLFSALSFPKDSIRVMQNIGFRTYLNTRLNTARLYV